MSIPVFWQYVSYEHLATLLSAAKWEAGSATNEAFWMKNEKKWNSSQRQRKSSSWNAHVFPISLSHSLTLSLSSSHSLSLPIFLSLPLSFWAFPRLKEKQTLLFRSLSLSTSQTPSSLILRPLQSFLRSRFTLSSTFSRFVSPLSPPPGKKIVGASLVSAQDCSVWIRPQSSKVRFFSWHAAWLKKNFDTKESSHRKIKNSSDKIARCGKEPRKDPRCSERRNGLLKQSRCYFCCPILFSRFVKKWFRLLPSFRRKFLSSFSDLKIRLCLKNNSNSKSSNLNRNSSNKKNNNSSKSSNLNRNSSNKKKNKSNSNIDCSLKNSYLCSM